MSEIIFILNEARGRQIFIAKNRKYRDDTYYSYPRCIDTLCVRCKMFQFFFISLIMISSLPVSARDWHDSREGRACQTLFFGTFFWIFSFLSRKTLYLFVLEARVIWLTALLVQHYEGFHPDLVALNRQPTGNQAAC